MGSCHCFAPSSSSELASSSFRSPDNTSANRGGSCSMSARGPRLRLRVRWRRRKTCCCSTGDATREGQCSRRNRAWRRRFRVGDETLGEVAREEYPRAGEVARRRDRPRRVLHSSEGAQRMGRTLRRFMLRSLLRPRMASWSAVGETMMVGSANVALPWATPAVILAGCCAGALPTLAG